MIWYSLQMLNYFRISENINITLLYKVNWYSLKNSQGGCYNKTAIKILCTLHFSTNIIRRKGETVVFYKLLNLDKATISMLLVSHHHLHQFLRPAPKFAIWELLHACDCKFHVESNTCTKVGYWSCMFTWYVNWYN